MESAAAEKKDFSFGFGDPNFSDRVLHIEIVNHSDDDLTRRTKTSTSDDVTTHATHQKSIHVSSLLLAESSRVFRRLFSNGMQETNQKHFTIQLKASEEAPFIGLLKYIYTNYVHTTLDDMLDLLVIADKFEVDSCMRECCRLLQNLPWTPESASLVLDLPPTVLEFTSFQPLVEDTKEYLIAHFNGLSETRFKEEMLELPNLNCIQAVLSSNKLQVTSENVVYDIVMAWAQKHYPNAEERREILKTHLLDLVRFPFMQTRKLMEEVQTCGDIDPLVAVKTVNHALYFKADPTGCVAGEKGNAPQLTPRAYKHRPVKVVKSNFVANHCRVYVELTKKELTSLSPGDEIRTETFELDGLELVIIAQHSKKEERFEPNLRLGVQVMKGSKSCSLSCYESSREFHVHTTRDSCSTDIPQLDSPGSFIQILRIKWDFFVVYCHAQVFNDVFHLWVDLTIKA